jgi:hypothetical protein
MFFTAKNFKTIYDNLINLYPGNIHDLYDFVVTGPKAPGKQLL